MIRMSHWHTDRTSGPTPTPPGGWYCWAHPVGAVGGFVAASPRDGPQRSFGWWNAAARATPATVPEARSSCANRAFADVAVPTPTLSMRTMWPPARATARTPWPLWPGLKTTRYCVAALLAPAVGFFGSCALLGARAKTAP